MRERERWNVGVIVVGVSGGGESVDLVNALKGDTVCLVRTSDEEKSGFELLEENNTLATEASREENKDAAGFETCAELRSVVFLGAGLTCNFISRIPLSLFDHWS